MIEDLPLVVVGMAVGTFRDQVDSLVEGSLAVEDSQAEDILVEDTEGVVGSFSTWNRAPEAF